MVLHNSTNKGGLSGSLKQLSNDQRPQQKGSIDDVCTHWYSVQRELDKRVPHLLASVSVDAHTSCPGAISSMRRQMCHPQPPLPRLASPQAAATTSPWLLASAVASLICGVPQPALPRGRCRGSPWTSGFYPTRVTLAYGSSSQALPSGVIGVVLGHLARARRAAPHSGHAALATAGLVLSYAGMLLILAFYVVLVLVAVHQMRS